MFLLFVWLFISIQTKNKPHPPPKFDTCPSLCFSDCLLPLFPSAGQCFSVVFTKNNIIRWNYNLITNYRESCLKHQWLKWFDCQISASSWIVFFVTPWEKYTSQYSTQWHHHNTVLCVCLQDSIEINNSAQLMGCKLQPGTSVYGGGAATLSVLSSAATWPSRSLSFTCWPPETSAFNC